jgi:uncharacterized protein
MMQTQFQEAHFPGRAPIDAYGNGGFRFAGMSHRGAIMCLPSGVHAWSAASPADFSERTFAPVFAEADDIEILIVGCGATLVPLGERLKMRLRKAAISADSMSTGAAVRTFNVLLAERRAVAAALLPVE